MRKLARIALVIVLLVGCALVIAPFFAGLYVERLNHQLVSAYSSPMMKIDFSQYHRGWFRSKATLMIEVNSPQWANIFQALNIPKAAVPTIYRIDQDIQHGPVFLHRKAGGPYFGWAKVHNQLQKNALLLELYKRLGVPPDFVKVDEDVISLTGRYFKHFVMGPYQTAFPAHNQLTIKLEKIEGNILLWPFSRVQGDIKVGPVAVYDREDGIELPGSFLNFDLHKTPQGLWLGNNVLTVPKLIWQEVGGKTFSMNGIEFRGDFNEHANALNGFRQFHVASIEFDNQRIGPLQLKISVAELNAQALADLITAYRETMQRGELYQSQLQQKIYMMLPKVINPGSRLQLNELSLNTEEGSFFMSGELSWPPTNQGIADDVFGLLKDADIQLKLRVSKKLTEQFILLVSGLSVFSQYQDRLNDAYVDARQDTYFAARGNDILLKALVDEKQITREGAYGLLALQKEWASLAEYNEAIRKLFLQKDISLLTSYQLSWHYMDVVKPLAEFDRSSKLGQTLIAEKMHGQLNDWIKEGYVLQVEDHYELSLSRHQGKLEVNQKPV